MVYYSIAFTEPCRSCSCCCSTTNGIRSCRDSRFCHNGKRRHNRHCSTHDAADRRHSAAGQCRTRRCIRIRRHSSLRRHDQPFPPLRFPHHFERKRPFGSCLRTRNSPRIRSDNCSRCQDAYRQPVKAERGSEQCRRSAPCR